MKNCAGSVPESQVQLLGLCEPLFVLTEVAELSKEDVDVAWEIEDCLFLGETERHDSKFEAADHVCCRPDGAWARDHNRANGRTGAAAAIPRRRKIPGVSEVGR